MDNALSLDRGVSEVNRNGQMAFTVAFNGGNNGIYCGTGVPVPEPVARVEASDWMMMEQPVRESHCAPAWGRATPSPMPPRKLPAPGAPTTLLPHLFEVLHDTKKTRVRDMLRAGLVHVNSASVTRHDHPVAPGDLIEIRDERLPPGRTLPFPVLFEDAHLLAIDKPCGLLTIASPSERGKTAHRIVNTALSTTRERAFVVHRLDRFTSGVLLFAKSEEAKSRVMGNWKAAQKTYHALVEGVPRDRERTLIHHLREDERLVMHAMDAPTRDSQRACLTYRVLSVRGHHALLEIDLDTGRKNQIRAQLAAIGHPIAGDAKYGARTDPIRRLCLHASRLSIPHPFTGERLVFESPRPPGFGP